MLLIFFPFRGGWAFFRFRRLHRRSSPPTAVASRYDNRQTTTNRHNDGARVVLFRIRYRTAFAAPSVVVFASDGDIQRAQRRPVDHRQTRWHRTKKSRSLSPVKQFPARLYSAPATAVFSPPVSPSPRRARTVRHRAVSSPPPPPPPATNRLIRAIVFANGANRKQNGGTVSPLDFSPARSISIITNAYIPMLSISNKHYFYVTFPRCLPATKKCSLFTSFYWRLDFKLLTYKCDEVKRSSLHRFSNGPVYFFYCNFCPNAYQFISVG